MAVCKVPIIAAALATTLLTSAARGEDEWRLLNTPPYVLNNKQDAISFTTEKRGWFGNGTGRVYRTDNGGEQWRKVWEKRGTYVRALSFIDQNVGFMGNVGPGYFPNVSDRQSLYRTRDGGRSWQAIKPSGGPTVTGICAIDAVRVDGQISAIRAGGRVGGPAGMLESFDAGETWSARDMREVTGMILDIKFVDRDVGFIAGATAAEEDRARARILKSTDAGKSWRVVYESDREGDNNWKLSFPTAAVGYGTIISYQAPDSEARGYVVKTIDGGEHWQKLIVTLDREWIPYGISFVDEKVGFVGGSTGGYETKDGGNTWTRSKSMGTSVNKFAVVAKDSGTTVVFSIGRDVRKLQFGQ